MNWIVYLFIQIELSVRSLAGVDNRVAIRLRNLLLDLINGVRLLLVQLD